VTALLGLAYLRHLLRQRAADRARIPALVATTLDRLATQAALHRQAAGDGEAWISVGQMRDDVLRDEFSVGRREGIWAGVKRVVESNANVRASVKEGRSGEVSRVWEWIGATAGSEERRKSGRISWNVPAEDGGGEDGTPLGKGREGDNNGEREGRKWDEGRPIY
jgi:hypothetical protein